jgi:hypothetical protein
MRFTASLLHGLALAAINVAAVLVGFARSEFDIYEAGRRVTHRRALKYFTKA